MKHIRSKGIHYFEIPSDSSDEVYNISIKLTCECADWVNRKIHDGQICKHLKQALIKLSCEREKYGK